MTAPAGPGPVLMPPLAVSLTRPVIPNFSFVAPGGMVSVAMAVLRWKDPPISFTNVLVTSVVSFTTESVLVTQPLH